MRHVALIPARGGSSAIKRKNLQTINGSSLVKIAWEQCVKSEIFDHIILSTDSDEILKEISSELDLNLLEDDSFTFFSNSGVIHKRIDLDSENNSLVSFLTFKIAKYFEIDYLWIIQPTSPFRSIQDFHQLKLKTQIKDDWSSIVSVKSAEAIHPLKMYYLEDYLVPIIKSDLDESEPRQKLPKVYIKDGAFYILKKSNLEKDIFLGERILPFVRESEMNVNIDLPEDLEFARFLSSINRYIT
jgi:CMP-N-acetylneuraminic acid synthetase